MNPNQQKPGQQNQGGQQGDGGQQKPGQQQGGQQKPGQGGEQTQRPRARSKNSPERPSAIGSCRQEARRRKLAERFAMQSAA